MTFPFHFVYLKAHSYALVRTYVCARKLRFFLHDPASFRSFLLALPATVVVVGNRNLQYSALVFSSRKGRRGSRMERSGVAQSGGATHPIKNSSSSSRKSVTPKSSSSSNVVVCSLVQYRLAINLCLNTKIFCFMHEWVLVMKGYFLF